MTDQIDELFKGLNEEEVSLLQGVFTDGLAEIAKQRGQEPGDKKQRLTLTDLSEAEAKLVTDALDAYRAPKPDPNDVFAGSTLHIPSGNTVIFQQGKGAIVAPKAATFGGTKPRKWRG